MTAPQVFNRISSLVAAHGYGLAIDEFDFERQPSMQIDQTYYVRMARTGTEGLIGPAQIETHRVEIWLARQPTRHQAFDAASSLRVDMEQLETAIHGLAECDVADGTVETEIGTYDDQADYLVGQLALSVEFERAW